MMAIYNPCVTFGGQPLHCVCDYFYFRGQTGLPDSVGPMLFVYNLPPCLIMAPSQTSALWLSHPCTDVDQDRSCGLLWLHQAYLLALASSSISALVFYSRQFTAMCSLVLWRWSHIVVHELIRAIFPVPYMIEILAVLWLVSCLSTPFFTALLCFVFLVFSITLRFDLSHWLAPPCVIQLDWIRRTHTKQAVASCWYT